MFKTTNVLNIDIIFATYLTSLLSQLLGTPILNFNLLTNWKVAVRLKSAVKDDSYVFSATYYR